MSAELAARRTAAAAVLTDYKRAVETADVMDRALWGARIADMLGYVLGELNALDAPKDAGSAPLDLTGPERSDLINVMTPDEIKALLAYITGYAPKIFDHALTSGSRSESFADELLGRIEERDQAEYMAEPDGYCIACGENLAHFIGYEGPQHFRGPHKLITGSEPRELFTPEDGHAPQVAWRYPDESPGGAQ